MSDVLPGVFFFVFCIHGCVLKIRAEARRRRAEPPPVPLRKAYFRGIAYTTVPAALALVVAVASGIRVFGSSQLDGKSVMLGLAFLTLMLGLDPLEWKLTPDKYKKRISNFAPRSKRERIIWVFCSLVAGVGEEIVYRAALYGILLQWTGNYWISAGISAAVFALGHSRWGMLGIMDAFLAALGFQLLVKISGGLYLAIIVHFVNNLLYGLVIGILLKPGARVSSGKASDSTASDMVRSPINDDFRTSAASAIETDPAES